MVWAAVWVQLRHCLHACVTHFMLVCGRDWLHDCDHTLLEIQPDKLSHPCCSCPGQPGSLDYYTGCQQSSTPPQVQQAVSHLQTNSAVSLWPLLQGREALKRMRGGDCDAELMLLWASGRAYANSLDDDATVSCKAGSERGLQRRLQCIAGHGHSCA